MKDNIAKIIKKFQEEIRLQNKTILELKLSLTEQVTEIKELESDIAVKDTTIDILRGALKDTGDKLIAGKRQHNDDKCCVETFRLKEENEKLKKQFNDCNTARNESHFKVQRLMVENENILEKNNLFNKHFSENCIYFSIGGQTQEDLQKENEELKAERNDLLAQSYHDKIFYKSFENIYSVYYRLRKENQKLETEIENLLNENEELKEQNEGLKEKIKLEEIKQLDKALKHVSSVANTTEKQCACYAKEMAEMGKIANYSIDEVYCNNKKLSEEMQVAFKRIGEDTVKQLQSHNLYIMMKRKGGVQ